jgi:hypothetical protein
VSTLPSLHDDYLISYEVDCEARRITLRARRPEWKEQATTRAIIFSGVESYTFRNDAFSNVIFALEEVPVTRIVSDFGAEITQAHRMAGAGGQWANDLATAPQTLAAMGIKGFILSASMGLSGWVLAKEAVVSPG